jgi:hypothetical protein
MAHTAQFSILFRDMQLAITDLRDGKNRLKIRKAENALQKIKDALAFEVINLMGPAPEEQVNQPETVPPAAEPRFQLFAYGAHVRKIGSERDVFSQVVGYTTARSKSEAVGIAYAETRRTKPGFDVCGIDVLEIPLELTVQEP